LVASDIDELRRVRSEAHVIFDSFWKCKRVGDRISMRNGCYEWLRTHTGMSKVECHFGKFDLGVCLAVIDLCRQAKAGLIDPPRMKGLARTKPSLDTKSSGRTSKRTTNRIRHRRF